MAAPTAAKSFGAILIDLNTLISARREVPDGQKLSDNIARMIEDSSRQLNNLYQFHTSDEEPSCQNHSLLLGVHGSIEDIPVAAKILGDLLKSEVIARRVLQLTPPGCKDFQVHRSLQKIWESLQSSNVQDKAFKQAVLEAFTMHSCPPTDNGRASGNRDMVPMLGSGPTNGKRLKGGLEKINTRRSDDRSTRDKRARSRSDSIELPNPEPRNDQKVSGSRKMIKARRSKGKNEWSIPVASVRFPDKLLWGECLAIIYDAARGFLVAQDVDKATAKAGSELEVAISRLTHLCHCPSNQYIQLHFDDFDRFVLDIKVHTKDDGEELIEKILYNGPEQCVVKIV
ncbi:MAG: hypothetical protein Q9184_005768 [Pyrenodesmia sp. 2 TL-2023]